MYRQCSCSGGNKDCSRCDGSGYLWENDPLPVSCEKKSGQQTLTAHPNDLNCGPHAKSMPPVLKVPQVLPAPPIRCPYCADRFNSAVRMEAHIDDTHVADAGDTSEQAKAKPLVRSDGQVFERRTLHRGKQPVIQIKPELKGLGAPKVRHDPQATARPATSNVAIPAKVVQASQVIRAKRPLIPCSRCSSPVREDRLTRHLQEQHGITGVSSLGAVGTPKVATTSTIPKNALRKADGTKVRTPAFAARRRVSEPTEELEDELPNELESYAEERRLDGSRDYWQIREDGRFGSHPSFDDCDDESAP